MSKVLHILPSGNTHHVPDMIRFLNNEVGPQGAHAFLIFGNTQKPGDSEQYAPLGKEGMDLTFLNGNRQELHDFFHDLPSTYVQIVIHSCFFVEIWIELLRFPDLCQKSTWLIWGGDLHSDNELIREGGLVFHIQNYMSRLFAIFGDLGFRFQGWLYGLIRSLGKLHWRLSAVEKFMHLAVKFNAVRKLHAVATLVPGDFELARSYYGLKVAPLRLFYPILLGEGEFNTTTNMKKDLEPVQIMVGNSGSGSNRHSDVFNMLRHFAEENIRIVCPLGYGGAPESVQDVIATGQNMFGSHFVALKTVMAKRDYLKLLNKMDALIYNHSRQQGLFGVYYFLANGKVVYLRSDSSSYNMLVQLGFQLRKTQDIPGMSFDDFKRPLSKQQKDQNKQKFEVHFSKAAAIDSWHMFLETLNLLEPSC